jgi:O-antigen/teichoic acid export membrane protein
VVAVATGVVFTGAGLLVVVVASRDGAVGVICDPVVDVGPAATAPTGVARDIPIHAMAAANLNDFTGPDNVDEHWAWVRPDELLRNMHGFSLPRGSSATVRTRMRHRISPLAERLKGSDTGKAAALAGAMIVNNVIALVSSVVFARLLNDYSALAALLSYLTILSVVGQAVQVATARDGVLGHLGTGEQLLATLERWARTLVVFTAFATVASFLLRQPIADAVGVPHQAWAAAVGIPAACVYLALCTLRGALQGVGDYRSVGLSLVGEQLVRLIFGTILAVVGLGIGGAYLGTVIAYVVMTGYCTWKIYARLAGPTYQRWRLRSGAGGALSFGRHIWVSAVPIAALGIIQLLQNVDLITARHQFSNRVASSYAVAAVAGKVMIWVAMGASFYLVPETSRLRSEGRDTRPVLLKSLGIVMVCAIPCILIFAVAAHPLLAVVFGKSKAVASASLLPLGAAFTVLAGTYLAVQYMLALKRVWFLVAIGIVAAIEPILLLQAPKHPSSFAAVVLLVQLLGAAVVYAVAFSRRPVLTQVA